MLPISADVNEIDFEVDRQPSYTYKITGNRIEGFIDDIEALKQAIYKHLNTIRYDCLIYSWDYGAELSYLIGQPTDTSLPSIKSNIIDALMSDDRILSVGDFEFQVNKSSITCSFLVNSIFGEFVETISI